MEPRVKPLIHIVGGGLAGCEAAWQALRLGAEVVLHEMRPTMMTAAHQTGDLAELVCSNSLKSISSSSAPGQLKQEMRNLDSLIIAAAEAAQVPAGQALAVDRKIFSRFISDRLAACPGFRRVDEEVTELPADASETPNERWIIATGPLTSPTLAQTLQNLSGDAKRLYFYDAIAPIIDAENIDFSECFRASRWDDNSDDYLNLPLNKEQYEAFIDAVIAAEKTPLHEFEEANYFESCLPIEVMIERGRDTLRFGPMKPVGLVNPKTGHRPWANVQLRMENTGATMYSMVGFQTKMKWPEQKRVFAMLPGLANAEFFRYGSVHRNTYLKSPEVLSQNLAFKKSPHVFLAGQITGVEGYTESAAIGLLAGRAAIADITGQRFQLPPANTVIGALAHYVTQGSKGEFQPMNANLGLLPPIAKTKNQSKVDRKAMQCTLAQAAFTEFMATGALL